MTPKQDMRLAMLSSGPCVPFDYVRGYYGVEWPLSDQSVAAFDSYVETLKRRARCPTGQVSRVELEGFMSLNNLLPKKWTGARLGMTVEPLNDLLSKLGAFGMQRERYELGSEFVTESFLEDLRRHIPGMRFRTFRDPTAYCTRLHAELAEFKIRVAGNQRVLCATSVKLQESPPRFAMHFDCLTLEPLSTKHSIWLNFRKPLNLPPDRC